MLFVEKLLEIHGIIFSTLVIFFISMYEKRDNVLKALVLVLAMNVGNLCSDLADICFSGRPGLFARWMVVSGNFCLYLFQQLLCAAMAIYVFEILRQKIPQMKKTWVYAVFAVCFVSIFFLILTPFTGIYYTIDADNVYHRGPYFIVVVLGGLLSSLFTIFQVLRNWKKLGKSEKYAVLTYYVLPLVGLVVQICWFGYSFMNIGITISVMILAVESTVRSYRKQRQKDMMIMQSRAYLLNSQIKPHFMFNSLSVIQALIEEDPRTAVDAINHFSRFLRTGMNLKVNEGLIPIKQELDYTQNYLYMEKLRFGEKVNVEYAIDPDVDFEIPFLTLQPIAENAVRHGLRKKKEGGTLRIEIRQDRDDNIIRVIDDGIGFDPVTVMQEGDEKLRKSLQDPEHAAESNGVGMVNVEERIRVMADGSLEIQSEPGKGTTVTIRIPIR